MDSSGSTIFTIMIAGTGNYFFNSLAITFLVPFLPDTYWSNIFINWKIDINIHFILFLLAAFIVYNNTAMFIKQFFPNIKSKISKFIKSSLKI